ncbi:hypothetical protein Csa_001275 [Cucumis sativus]|uniref:Uncharacterized protein n=1 Tax=Cucumis sativus TaxID=3659 RepID=A0A0A0L9Y4_CUCSA|nr:hypothetical protein Csa_001275 [Cucumis sativus]
MFGQTGVLQVGPVIENRPTMLANWESLGYPKAWPSKFTGHSFLERMPLFRPLMVVVTSSSFIYRHH